MNSFESDMKRAVFSKGFIIAVIVSIAVLFSEGFGSGLYMMSVPLVCSFPYACGWLDECKSGFAKYALARGGRKGYILGKYLACGISGGAAEVLPLWIYALFSGAETGDFQYHLVFLSGMLWASASAVLAAASDSKYIAYGGAFVIYYFLIILHDRYWNAIYCLYPCEWISPEHIWVLGDTGVVLLLSSVIICLGTVYYLILERRLENV